MKKHTLAALALVAGSTASMNTVADDCYVDVSGGNGNANGNVQRTFSLDADAVVWPPNHKLHTVQLEVYEGNCSIEITDVKQSEPASNYVTLDDDGNRTEYQDTGAGNTAVDAGNCANNGTQIATVDIRAERSGNSAVREEETDVPVGRFYRVFYTLTHDHGETEPGDALLLVPHDQRKKQPISTSPATVHPSNPNAATACEAEPLSTKPGKSGENEDKGNGKNK